MDLQPLVFIIDVDGTLIGDVSPQLCVYDLKQDRLPLKYSTKELSLKFDQGLLRPYFDAFYKNVKNRLPNAEFFVYTASEDRWGNFIVGAIEKHLGIRFNRPIFTRKHCFAVDRDFRKSFKHIEPAIHRALKKKYGKNLSLANRVVLIDNREVYAPEDQKKLLLCPSYDCEYHENLPALLSEEAFQKHRPSFEAKLRKYYPSLPAMRSYVDFQCAFYEIYLQCLKRQCSQRIDKFWFFLYRLMEFKNLKIFTPRAIEYMNRKLSKRL